MAKPVTVSLVDDIDGTPADETVTFSIDGLNFEIDLGSDNAAKLRSDLMAWAEAGRPAEEAKRDRMHGNPVRDWARRHGHDVAERGWPPLRLVDASESAT